MDDDIQDLYGWHKPSARLPSLPKMDYTVISVTTIDPKGLTYDASTSYTTEVAEREIAKIREALAFADPYRKRIVPNEIKKSDSDRAPGSKSICRLDEIPPDHLGKMIKEEELYDSYGYIGMNKKDTI